MTIKLIERAREHGNRIALLSKEGKFSYQDLLNASARLATLLLAGKTDLNEVRVAYLIPSGPAYVATQWGIWRAGGIAVPLSVSHPLPELEYVISNSGAEILVIHPDYLEKLQSLLQFKHLKYFLSNTYEEVMENTPLPDIAEERRAMIVYTSGTTSKPKGVVTTHRNIEYKVKSLVEAWEWNCDDHILHVLPLHHVHGIINVLTCALWAGARCEMLPQFEVNEVIENISRNQLTLFMAVPTIYKKLINALEQASSETRLVFKKACQHMRLMVSGSAALPVTTLQKWQDISGHTLLERYGMSEIGMALSNPLHGKRLAGFVGKPLPYVEVKLLNEEGELCQENESGEIYVKGPTVFKEYWQNPEATKNTFRNGWFRTGDIAVIEQGNYRILGRSSVDIIKSGGYKISALEIEEVLRTHPQIKDLAVVGMEDEEWGEIIAAAIVTYENESLEPETLQSWIKERLAAYKTPRKFIFVTELPHNSLGKVVKPVVKELFA